MTESGATGKAGEKLGDEGGKVSQDGMGSIRRLMRAKFLIPALIVLIGTVWSVLSMGDGAARLARMTSTAGGRIVDITTYTHRDDDGNEDTTYRPVIEFEDSDHISHTAKSLHASKESNRYRIGKHVSVLYDPRDADSGCVLKGEEKLVSVQSAERGPLGIIITWTIAAIAFVILA